MTDRLQRDEHPVAFGLLALVGVAVVVGVVAGLVAVAGARVVGLDSGGPTGGSEEQASLYLPKPKPTRGDDGPLITLAPGRNPDKQDDAGEVDATDESRSEAPKQKISLQVARSSVSPMDNIDLTGVYPGGEGAILQVQRFENGSWADFPVTASVSDGTFATYVQTGQGGVNRFRVIDTDTQKASNEVKVTIG